MMNEWIISSSVLIAAVLLVRFALRGRISLRLQYALWAVVLVRLLLPVQIFTSDFGTGSIAREVDITRPVRQVYMSANPERYARAYDEAVRQAAAQHVGVSESVSVETIEQEAAELARNSIELDLAKLLRHTWLGGMTVMASVIVFCNVHLGVQLKRRRWALDIPESLLPVYVTEAVPTPCVFGFFRPVIYLTPDAAKEPGVRAHVLEHELTHYRHFDHVWSVLRSVCLVLHWYNPLVWIAARVSRADAELACDEGALEKLGESQRFDYGRTLIGLTCSAPISGLLLTATTMTGSAGSLRERIRLLTKRPRNTVLTVTAVIVMVTLIVGCTFSGAPETTEPAEPGVDNDMSYTEQELPIPDDPAAPITADFAGEELQAQHSYQADESEYLTDIAFTATEQLLDVEFGLLQLTETAGWQMEVLDAFPSLQPDEAFLARVTFWGDATTYGIRFTDAAGRDRRFAVSISGEDGSLVCTEYSSADPGLMDASGLLVYPGTEWGMTEEEVLEALDIREYGPLSGLRGFQLNDADFWGYPAAIVFYFDRWRSGDEWGLCSVRVTLQDEDAANGVNELLYEKLGRCDFQASGVAHSAWHSDARLADMISPEAYATYQEHTEEYPAEGGAASVIEWYGGGYPTPENTVTFSSGLHIARQIEASLMIEPTAPSKAPSSTEAVTDVVNAFTQAWTENIWLGADNDYDHLTVLAADPKMTVPYTGGTAVLSDFHKNIRYLHDKEAYWRHHRQDSGILQTSFTVTSQNHQVRFEDGAATVQVDVNVSFCYEDSPGLSGLGTGYEITLVQADGEWRIADVLELNDWFDAEYKNAPDFDVDQLING